MAFCIDRRLHVVADDAGTTAARDHRTAVGIGERYLLIGRRQNLFFNGCEFRDFNGQIFEPFFDPRLFQFQRFRRLPPVGGIELSEIARNTLLQLHAPPLDFATREVLIAIIDCLEFAGDAGCREQPHLAAHLDEARADFF